MILGILLGAAASTYLCIADDSVGFKVNEAGEWKRVNFEEARLIVKQEDGWWEINRFGGGGMQYACSGTDAVHCQDAYGEFKMDPEKLRYTRTYTYGFVENDGDGNTPLIEIGKCSPL